MAGRRIGQELQHGERRDRLARAGFADQRHRLALGDVEGDVVDGGDGLAALREGDGEVADGEEGLRSKGGLDVGQAEIVAFEEQGLAARL